MKSKVYLPETKSKQKDIDRKFGVLQAHFAIIRQPDLARDKNMLGKIIISCIIIHNIYST